MSLEGIKHPRQGRSASRSGGGWNDHPKMPSNGERMMLVRATSSYERRQLEIPETTTAHRRSASLTRRVNVFEEYEQTQSMIVTSKIAAKVNALRDSGQGQSLNDTNKMDATRGIKKRTNSLTSDRLASSRSRSNATLHSDIGRPTNLEVYDRIQSAVSQSKSPPMSPPRPHGGRVSYNKALGDVVMARSLSGGSENCSIFHEDNDNVAMRRLSSPTYSRYSTVNLPENQDEDKVTSYANMQVGKYGYSSGPTTTFVRELSRRPGTTNNIRKGTKVTPSADLQKLKYDGISGSYYDDVSDVLKSKFDARSTLDNASLQSGSLNDGRDDRSAETGSTDVSDYTDTSDIIMEDLREEAAEMCGRTCYTLDASLGNIMQTRTYRILSMIGKKVIRETIKGFQWIQKLEFSEVTGCMDKSFKCVSAVMDAECEKCESKAKYCAE